MLVTGWKRAIMRSGRTQRALAQALSVNLSRMNMVVAGEAWLTKSKFDLACELLGVRPQELYTPEALALLYGIGETKPLAEAPAKKRRARIELDDDNLDRVDSLAQDERLTRTQAANTIIRRAYETRRIEACQ